MFCSGWVFYSSLNCIVAPGLLLPCRLSQPQRSFSYALGFLPCRPTKSPAALDAKKLYTSITLLHADWILLMLTFSFL
jgi:hypothetical protein